MALSPKLIMFCYWSFIFGHIICLMLEGLWLGTDEETIVESLVGFNVTSVGGWEIPKLIGGFFLTGVPTLVSWDYSFLHGDFAIFRFTLLTAITIGVIYGLAQAVAPYAYNLVTKLLSW